MSFNEFVNKIFSVVEINASRYSSYMGISMSQYDQISRAAQDTTATANQLIMRLTSIYTKADFILKSLSTLEKLNRARKVYEIIDNPDFVTIRNAYKNPHNDVFKRQLADMYNDNDDNGGSAQEISQLNKEIENLKRKNDELSHELMIAIREKDELVIKTKNQDINYARKIKEMKLKYAGKKYLNEAMPSFNEIHDMKITIDNLKQQLQNRSYNDNYVAGLRIEIAGLKEQLLQHAPTIESQPVNLPGISAAPPVYTEEDTITPAVQYNFDDIKRQLCLSQSEHAASYQKIESIDFKLTMLIAKAATRDWQTFAWHVNLPQHEIAAIDSLRKSNYDSAITVIERKMTSAPNYRTSSLIQIALLMLQPTAF